MQYSENPWYILSVISGQENKVFLAIKSMVDRGLFTSSNIDILLPQRSTIDVKNGKKSTKQAKLYPGYIFIRLDIGNIEDFQKIGSVPGAVGFLGGVNSPKSLTKDEIEDIVAASKQFEAVVDDDFEVGISVKVIDGPFESFIGTVQDYDHQKKKIKVSVSIFGRATMVELSVNQVEKFVENNVAN